MKPGPGMIRLDNGQLEKFDQDHVRDGLWAHIKAAIDRDFPDGRFTFLDLGGGNGNFADRVLASYPEAEGTVLDNSALLLGKNRPHPRKRLVAEGAENLGRLEIGTFDLVCCNMVLHHMLGAGYAETRGNILRVLADIRRRLTARGRISICENCYDGLWADNAPGWIIYQLTSTPWLAPLARGQGANTAGVGVCFQSLRSWRALAERAGFGGLEFSQDMTDIWGIPLRWALFLHLRAVRVGHLWGRAAVQP
jgi:SAM-dependent methyltransferase